jgi:hypothetical protein
MTAPLHVRTIFAATLGLLSVQAFAQALQPGEFAVGSQGPALSLDLALITSIPRSIAAWLQDSVRDRALSHSKAIMRSGACEYGLAQGCAIIDWLWFGDRPNEHYEGEFREGTFNGHGVYQSTDGRRYEGEFRDGKLYGRGVYTWPNGSRYEGEWRDGTVNGMGKLITASGIFDGTWMDGCFRRGNTWMAIGRASSSCRALTKTRWLQRNRNGVGSGKIEAHKQIFSRMNWLGPAGKPSNSVNRDGSR